MVGRGGGERRGFRMNPRGSRGSRGSCQVEEEEGEEEDEVEGSEVEIIS